MGGGSAPALKFSATTKRALKAAVQVCAPVAAACCSSLRRAATLWRALSNALAARFPACMH
jgi:hypothetical protein